MQSIESFIKFKKIKLLAYQDALIDVFKEKSHGIIEAPTGRGKTLAVALGIISYALTHKIRPKILWVTPMRALARDTSIQLDAIFSYFIDDIQIISRTSDSSSYQKKKARDNKWDILITTPESCALFSTYSDMQQSLSSIDFLIVDEWHVLLHQKRGVLFELFMSWLTNINSKYCRWALSATMSSVKKAASVLAFNQEVKIIKDNFRKSIEANILLPESDNHTFGQLGKKMIDQLIQDILKVSSVIIFTNTRSQSEQWYQLLLESGKFKQTEIAIHHSAVATKDRFEAEEGIKSGRVRCIVATSSLDLGVDLEPVDRVIHIGSPKGMARLKQRAGRSGHSPFETASITMVPRNGFEVIEAVAAIEHISLDDQDDLPYLNMPIDVLMQHLVNICMSASYSFNELFEICRHTYTYSTLSKIELQWVLDFCCNKHTLLKAYPEHVKLIFSNGEYDTNPSKMIQKAQRFSIGAITSEEYLTVKYTNQRTLGSIEEQFIRQLKPTDSFLFAGHILSVKRIQDDVVYVKKSKSKLPKYARWLGGYMSYSTQLSNYLLKQLDQFNQGKPIQYSLAHQFLNWQANVSIVPKNEECLVEIIQIDNCSTLFIYPFCGRSANQALAMGLTYQISNEFKCHTGMSVNDYGIMIQCDQQVNLTSINIQSFLNLKSVHELSLESFNHNEMILQEFRQICLVSGLISKGLPGRLKSNRYTQSSIRILYDIFKEFDPDNLLLKQARDFVFDTQLFPKELQDRLNIISKNIVVKKPSKITPFAYTLYQEQLTATMRNNGH